MKRLFYASLALVALASCQKESSVDTALSTAGTAITYAPYAGSSTATKGTAINSNTDFVGSEGSYGSFEVAAYSGTLPYFGFSQVTYDGSAWENDDTMYWPNEDATLHFGAYYPATATFSTDPAFSYASDANSLTFGYTVTNTVANQLDLMYAITNVDFDVDDSDSGAGSEDAVNLHFKHALTQVSFTATKDDDITVSVTSVKICNVVDNGTFEATAITNYDGSATITEDQDDTEVNTANFGAWTPETAAAKSGENTTNLSHYAAAMASTSAITVIEGATATQLTSTTDVLMLLPQELEAWDAETSSNNDGTESYLAIACTITHTSGGNDAASIVNGTLYVPFSTEGITYNDTNTTDDKWNPGYKITYNLHFGGGYTVPGGETDPDPGETPDDLEEDVVTTLRSITYTTTVDEWIPVAADEDVEM